MEHFRRTDRAEERAVTSSSSAAPASVAKATDQSPLKAPLSPRSGAAAISPLRGGAATTAGGSSSPQRRTAAIFEAFDAVKLDDDSALYACLFSPPSGAGAGAGAGAAAPLVDPNAAEPNNPKRTTLLHWAAYLGSALCFDLLVQCAGIDLDSRESDGKTPLHYAAFQGQRAMIEALVERGADECVADTLGQTPCHLARIAGREDVARMFANYHAVLDESTQEAVQSDTSFVPGGAGVAPGQHPVQVGEEDDDSYANASPRAMPRRAEMHDTLDRAASAAAALRGAGGAAASPGSQHSSPRLMPSRLSASSGAARRSVSAEAQLGNAFQGRQPTKALTHVAVGTSAPNSPTRLEQQQQQQQQLQSPNISAVVHRRILGPEPGEAEEDPAEELEARPSPPVDPALRRDAAHDDELQRLADDEAELAAMEAALEMEEAAQRVAQAQLAWLDRVRRVAQEQHALDKAQLSERLWAVAASVEDMLFVRGGSSSPRMTHGQEPLVVRTELEARAVQQIRAVTGSLEQTLIQQRIEREAVPLVMFRWNPTKTLDQHQQQQHASITFGKGSGASDNDLVSPLSQSGGGDSAGRANAGRSRQQQQQQQQQKAPSFYDYEDAKRKNDIAAGFRSMPVLGRRAATTTSVAASSVAQRRHGEDENPSPQPSGGANAELVSSHNDDEEPAPRDPAACLPEQEQHVDFERQYGAHTRRDAPKFPTASTAAPRLMKAN